MVKKTIKKFIAIIITLIVIVSASLLIYNITTKENQNTITGQATKAIDEETIKIGVAYSLSGPGSFFGLAHKKGTELAIEEINSNGGINGYNLELIFEDTKGESKDSANAGNKLINIDDVDYVFSDLTLTSSIISDQVINNQKFMFYVGSLNSRIAQKNDFIFKENINIEESCKLLAKETKKRGINEVGFLRANSEWTEPCVESFTNEFLKDSNNKIFDETYNFGDKDLSTQVLKLKDEKVEAVFLLDYSTLLPLSIKELTSQYEPELLILDYAADPTVKTDLTYGVFSRIETIGFYPDFNVESNDLNDQAKKFVQDYEAKYEGKPNYNSAYSYEAVYSLAKAMNNCDNPKDYGCVSNNLKSMKRQGILGDISFDEHGVTFRNPNLVEFQNGEWVNLN